MYGRMGAGCDSVSYLLRLNDRLSCLLESLPIIDGSFLNRVLIILSLAQWLCNNFNKDQ